MKHDCKASFIEDIGRPRAGAGIETGIVAMFLTICRSRPPRGGGD